MGDPVKLRAIQADELPSTADLVFRELYERVVGLALPPGTKISEVDVANQMDVSRQPVRDAFYRLSTLGFLIIRPQRATTVAPISVRQVEQARFIRTAIELETIRLAGERATERDFATLEDNLSLQREAVQCGDKRKFQALDDHFHQLLCEMAGQHHVWTLIQEKKAHMDRVRFLSLDDGAETALNDHVEILTALRSRDLERAAAAVRLHLSRITEMVERLRGIDGQLLVEDI
jgi:DNA-binding GntR family transcriptional regulator